MLGNEQLRQAREDVATRDAEIDELKQRVAELEKLRTDQQTLVQIKDNQLAAAEHRLGQTPPPVQEAGGPWYWLGLPILLLAGAGWWLARRRKPSPLPPLRRDDHDDSTLATSVPAGAGLDVLTERDGWDDDGLHAVPTLDDARPVEVEAVPALPTAATMSPLGDDPATPADVVSPEDGAVSSAVEAGDIVADAVPDPVPAYARKAEQQDDFRGVFDLPADEVSAAPASVDAHVAHEIPSQSVPHDAGHDRLELAIAYLDLGDAQTARALLEEVAAADDPHLRAQARELLARLG